MLVPAGRLAVVFIAGLMAISEISMLAWRDISTIHESRQAAAREAEVLWQHKTGGGGAPPGAAHVAPPLSRVALLFLTTGALPTEPVWRLFLESATTAVRRAVGPACQGSRRPVTRGCSWRQLFSLYTHPPPGYQHPAGSLFAGTEVPDRVKVEWAQHSMVDAERALLRAALRDRLNARFVLLSDTCIPLYPAPLVYVQLMSETRSRINACRDTSDWTKEADKRMAYRWTGGMAQFGVSWELWRKSSQWVVLTRRHAEAVAQDSTVDAAFRQECWTSQPHRFCVSDEHYIPTLLAVLGWEAEAACDGVTTYTRWEGPFAHPKTFGKGEATAQVLAEMRGGCNGSVLAAASMQVLEDLVHGPGIRQRHRSRAVAAGTRGGAKQAAPGPAAKQHPLPPSCPLFGRKVAADAVQEWEELLSPVMMES